MYVFIYELCKPNFKKYHQEFIVWLRNTWRTESSGPKTKLKKYTLPNLLWYLHRDDVLKEISTIMGSSEVDTFTPGWFQFRTVATKNILRLKTEAEKEELRKKGEEFAKIGLPEDIQRK